MLKLVSHRFVGSEFTDKSRHQLAYLGLEVRLDHLLLGVDVLVYRVELLLVFHWFLRVCLDDISIDV